MGARHIILITKNNKNETKKINIKRRVPKIKQFSE